MSGQHAVVYSVTATQYLRKTGHAEKLDGKREIRLDHNLPYQTVYEEIKRFTIQEDDSLDSLVDAGRRKSKRDPH